jgi:membrane protease YdiL (CAAX protease family)
MAVEILILILLLAVVPLLSYLTVRRLEGQVIARLALYVSAILSLWILALLTVGAMLATGTSAAEAGFREIPLDEFWRWTAILWGVGVTASAGGIALERRGWWPEESPLLENLLPRTFREKLWAVLIVSPSAALCEEFVYRGYLLGLLLRTTDSELAAVAISSAAFGAAHVYQGWAGIARAALLGAVLAYPVLMTGSIYPSMAAHFLIDAVALGWLGPRFLARKAAAQE